MSVAPSPFPSRRKQSAQASEKLRERERLRQVVVRARVQPGDPAVDLGACGEHQHRDLVPGASQASAHFEPVGARHEDVEDDRVRLRVELEPPKRLLTVLGELDAVALELERPPQGVAHRALVVDDQDVHEPHCAHWHPRRGAGLSDFLGALSATA